eukprot:6423744-Pyramimonas_sp.AAC.1
MLTKARRPASGKRRISLRSSASTPGALPDDVALRAAARCPSSRGGRASSLASACSRSNQ